MRVHDVWRVYSTWRAVGASSSANGAARGRACRTLDARVFEGYGRIFADFAVLARGGIEHVLAGPARTAQVSGGGAEFAFCAPRALRRFRHF